MSSFKVFKELFLNNTGNCLLQGNGRQKGQGRKGRREGEKEKVVKNEGEAVEKCHCILY